MSPENLNVPRVGVGVFVLKAGKFLLGKRLGEHGTGAWSVPGGWLEFGETFEAAAKREVKEETNLDIQNIRIGAVTNAVFANEGTHSVAVWLLSDWRAGEPTIMEPEKFAEQGWFDFESLPEPMYLHFEELLESKYIEEIKKLTY